MFIFSFINSNIHIIHIKSSSTKTCVTVYLKYIWTRIYSSKL